VIYGIEQSTDSRDKSPIIKKFSSELKAKQWITPPRLCDPGAANSSLPIPSQNFHKILRSIWRMPYGWKMPSEKRLLEGKSEPWRYSIRCLKVNAIMREGTELT